MQNHRWYHYAYQAILINGEVVRLGTSTSETFLNGGALSSNFGGITAVYEETFEYDSIPCPDELIPIVEPEELRRIWDDQDYSVEKRNAQRMLERCCIPPDQVIGFIVTVSYQDNFYDDWAETTIVSKSSAPQRDPDALYRY